jgi:hypothetical protein
MTPNLLWASRRDLNDLRTGSGIALAQPQTAVPRVGVRDRGEYECLEATRSQLFQQLERRDRGEYECLEATRSQLFQQISA